MSTEEEPDYMSEEFLASCVKDVRPGLVYKQSLKRKFQVEEEQKQTNEKMRSIHKPVRILEAERREEGMKQALPAQNKGFAMLQKMGYNPGQGLGKSGEGRIEPVAVELKADRGGLGRDAAVKEILTRKLTMLAKKISNQSGESSINEFRNRMKDLANQRLVAADLGKSQRMCGSLDEKNNIEHPVESWFWPARKVPKEEEDEAETKKTQLEEEVEEDIDEEEDKLEPTEKLELLTAYLRQVYFYCIWCGTKFEDSNDLSTNCPGISRDDH